ncbi:hypothetical protein [Arthrobacter mangrovi]|nr:hypothetical protein [Arthrobacter mangrovi]
MPVNGNPSAVGGHAAVPALPFRSVLRSVLDAPATRMLVVVEVFFLGVLAAAGLAQAWSDSAVPAMLIAAALIPSAVELAFNSRCPTWLHGCYFVFLLAGPFVGTQMRLYAFWTLWDKPVHAFSGALVGWATVFALGVACRRTQLALPPFLMVAGVVLAGGFIAAMWEIAEFTSDHFLGTRAQNAGLVDTVTDMMCGILGVAAVAVVAGLHFRGRPSVLIGSLVRSPDIIPPAPPREQR